MKPAIAVDFDGTLYQEGPWLGSCDYSRGPIPGALEWLAEALIDYDIIIHTCRFSRWNAQPAMNDVYPPQTVADVTRSMAGMSAWFDRHGIDPDRLIYWAHPGKPYAEVYLDDRMLVPPWRTSVEWARMGMRGGVDEVVPAVRRP